MYGAVKLSLSSMVEHLFNAASISEDFVKAIVIELLDFSVYYKDLDNQNFPQTANVECTFDSNSAYYGVF